MTRALRVLGAAVLLAGLAWLAVRVRYGGGTHMPDRTGAPILDAAALELVADLGAPPGNIAVSADGRIFVSFHPEAGGPVKVAEVVGGEARPWPDADHQRPRGDAAGFDTVLSLRVDRQGRLWTLDYARHGLGRPRLSAFDLASGAVLHDFSFPSEVAGLGSMLNDLQIDAEGRFVYIAEASIFAKTPALVVYDVENRRARRLLDGHPSVLPDRYISRVQGRDIVVLGAFVVRPGVDSIALDRRGEWLYYAAVTADHMFRVRASDLRDEGLDADALGARVEPWALKTASDGITIDDQDRLYLTDPDHSALHRLGPDRTLETLFEDDRLRWPDGLSFGPDGWVYVTCSALQHVIFRSGAHVRAHAPYQVYRFRSDGTGAAGH